MPMLRLKQGTVATSLPLIKILPSEQRSKPAMTFKRVVLPDPDEPRIETNKVNISQSSECAVILRYAYN